jgi:hypothetical protein
MYDSIVAIRDASVCQSGTMERKARREAEMIGSSGADDSDFDSSIDSSSEDEDRYQKGQAANLVSGAGLASTSLNLNATFSEVHCSCPVVYVKCGRACRR